ncbi:TonB-dependent receptor [Thalassotalea agariperforans]
MSIKRQGFKLSTLSLAILTTMNFNALAFEEEATDKKDKEKDAVEVIEVTGFRGSVMKSMNAKRFSENVSDSIYAEDIGKSTDQNIADALSRVTGVSVQSTDGEGTKITVRGANPNQNVITMNGVTLTSSDENQSVDLSTFSSDILSHINVIKTPSADHDEGSLGASVQLNTTKPLDVNNNIRTFTVQGRYSDFSEESDHKISGTISHKFNDDTIGVLFSAYDETSSIRRDQIDLGRYEPFAIDKARDLDGNIVTDTEALISSNLKYSLFQNKRDRQGATLSLQFLPTDSTNINFDFIYGKQNTITSNDSIQVRTIAASKNYVEGVPNLELTKIVDEATVVYAPTFSDPQEDWWTIDTQNKTMVKTLNRFADGGYGRVNGGDSTTNHVVNLSLEQYITDDFKVDVGVNYSKTELEPISSLVVNLQGGKYGKQYADAYGTPHTGIKPAGYDCTSGTCYIVGSDGFVSAEDPTQQFDGRTSTAFNPEDITAQGTNNVRIRDKAIEDEQKTAFIDFDWELDFYGLTKFEFGVKYSERNKMVDDQEGKFENAGKAIVVDIFDKDGNITGTRIVQPGQSLGAVPATNYLSDEKFPYDDFMQDLGVPLSNVTDGWPLISASKLLALANTTESLAYTVDPSKSRTAELKNQAAYIKFSFSPMDKLTGDIGLRWVRTDVETSGYSGVNYFRADSLDRVYDPFLFRQLRNPDTPNGACDIARDFPNPATEGGKHNRLDGLGWDFNGTPDDYSDDVRWEGAPNGYPCYDPDTERSNIAHWKVGRHNDISHAPRYYWGESSDPALAEDRSTDVFKTAGTNTYDMYLPSLNLNYQVEDDIIARFAVSKTMARPPIDDLKPGFAVNEGIWGADYTNKGSNVILSNTQLKPEESKNIDLSFEWYFNEAGMLSATLFNKDMTNFIAQESLTTYLADLRYVDPSLGYDSTNLLKSAAEVEADFNADTLDGVGTAACFPDRGNVGSLQRDWWYSENLIDLCKKFNVSTVRNGAAQTIRGAEISYNQTYDFLPGVFAGLGSQFSYTYSESETEAEASVLDSDIILKAMPALWTPKHSYNATLFWEQHGHQIRLSYRGKSDELIRRNIDNGHVWREGSGVMDLSINYKATKNVLVSFQTINLLDESTRDYFTSESIVLNGEEFNEGNALDGGVTSSRTRSEFKSGRTFRLGVRVNF